MGLSGAAAGTPAADTLRRLDALAARLVTPQVRYSRPCLQAHVVYLYSLGIDVDQRIGSDAEERYGVLRREVDAAAAELRAILGGR